MTAVNFGDQFVSFGEKKTTGETFFSVFLLSGFTLQNGSKYNEKTLLGMGRAGGAACLDFDIL